MLNLNLFSELLQHKKIRLLSQAQIHYQQMFSYLKSVIFGAEGENLEIPNQQRYNSMTSKSANPNIKMTLSVDKRLQNQNLGLLQTNALVATPHNNSLSISLTNKNAKMNPSKLMQKEDSKMNQNQLSSRQRYQNQFSYDSRLPVNRELPLKASHKHPQAGKFEQTHHHLDKESSSNNMSNLSQTQKIPILSSKNFSTGRNNINSSTVQALKSRPQKLIHLESQFQNLRYDHEDVKEHSSELLSNIEDERETIKDLSGGNLKDQVFKYSMHTVQNSDPDYPANQVIVNYESNSSSANLNSNLMITLKDQKNYPRIPPNKSAVNQQTSKTLSQNKQLLQENLGHSNRMILAGQLRANKSRLSHNQSIGGENSHIPRETQRPINLNKTVVLENLKSTLDQNQQQDQFLSPLINGKVIPLRNIKDQVRREVERQEQQNQLGPEEDETVKHQSKLNVGNKASFRYIKHPQRIPESHRAEDALLDKDSPDFDEGIEEFKYFNDLEDGSITIRNQMSVDFKSNKTQVFTNLKLSTGKVKPPIGPGHIRNASMANSEAISRNLESLIRCQSSAQHVQGNTSFEDGIPIVQDEDDESVQRQLEVNWQSMQKLFMDSKGASQILNVRTNPTPQSLKNGASSTRRHYQISQNLHQFELSLPQKDLKFISVNMLSRNLKIIDLQKNKLSSLPEEIADLTHLEKLRVENNQLKSLPSRLYQLRALQNLTASHNELKALPDRIEELYNLEIMILNDNKIESLTHKLGNLSKLKKLFLHNN